MNDNYRNSRNFVLIKGDDAVQKADHPHSAGNDQPGGVEAEPTEIQTHFLAEIPSEKWHSTT
jgi:hypothetical protein